MKAALMHHVVIVQLLLHVTAVQYVATMIHVALAMQMLVVAVHRVAHVALHKLFDVNFN